MAGKIHSMIQTIVRQKSKGNETIANIVRTKMYLKGIAVDKYTAASPDDPAIIRKLQDVAKEFGVAV